VGANPDSEWVETLWESGNLGSAAVGLSEFLSGFAGVAKSDRRYKMGEALDYAGKLVRSTKLETSSTLSSTMKKASFINYLVDLGGSYSNYRTSVVPTNSNFYLNTIWSSADIMQNSSVMANYWQQVLNANNTSDSIKSTFQFLASLEFSYTDRISTYKGQHLAQRVRNGFSNYGKYQLAPNGGGDDPLMTTGIGIVEYVNYLGELFIRGGSDSHAIFYDDARQGLLGDCYLMAAMAAVALHRPNIIRSMIQENGDGTYNVIFASGSLTVGLRMEGIIPTIYVDRTNYETRSIDADLPTFDIRVSGSLAYGKSSDFNPSGQRELWPSLIEKAYALVFGGGSYKGIEWGNAGDALRRITGVNVNEYDLDGRYPPIGQWSEDEILSKIKESIIQGQPTTISSKSTTIGIPPSHVFVPIAVDSARREVSLYDPDRGLVEKVHISTLQKDCDYLWIAE
jgi:hypothetical protein